MQAKDFVLKRATASNAFSKKGFLRSEGEDMSAKLVLILAVLNLVGCSESAKQVTSDNLRAVGLPSLASKPPLTDADKIALLRAEAHKRGLRWRIFCTGLDGGENQYQADVWEKDRTFSDMALNDLPRYYGNGATQAEAAYSAYYALIEGRVHRPTPSHASSSSDKCARDKDLSGD